MTPGELLEAMSDRYDGFAKTEQVRLLSRDLRCSEQSIWQALSGRHRLTLRLEPHHIMRLVRKRTKSHSS
jgi:hypothetical protein